MVHIDAIIVGIAMIIGFCVIIMKFTGFWPCRIAETFHIDDISCTKTFGENLSSIASWMRNSTGIHFGLQFLRNVLLQ